MTLRELVAVTWDYSDIVVIDQDEGTILADTSYSRYPEQTVREILEIEELLDLHVAHFSAEIVEDDTGYYSVIVVYVRKE